MPRAAPLCLLFALAPACVGGCATARAASACAAPLPAIGATFSGPVLEVIDGARLCVAQGPGPGDWIAVQLPGLPEPGLSRVAARSLLMAATFSRRLDCVVQSGGSGAVLAICTVEGAALDQQLREARARPDWRDWR